MNLDNLPTTPIVISGDTKRIEDNSQTFKYCGEIIIEEGVEEIGGWAFAWCTVDKATIPSSVVKIEENPFPHTHIFNVICNSPFYEVKDGALIEKETKRFVSFVGKDRYSGKKFSEQRAADGNTSLRYEYTIPSYIKILGEGSFRGRKLDKIIIPSTVEKILQNPFVYCDAEVENHSPFYKLENGLLIELSSNTLLSYVKREKDIIVPEGVEIIEGSTFELLEYGVNSITLPTSIKEIRDNFGAECHIQHIYVPAEKLDFFKKLLPDYKDIISVKGAKAITTEKPIVKAPEPTKPEPKASSNDSYDTKEELSIKEEVKRDFKAPKALIIFTFFFCLIIGCAFSYLLGSLCSWDFNLSEWNVVSIILASIALLLTLVVTVVVTVTSYKSEKKEFEDKVRRNHSYRADKERQKKQIKAEGGMSKVYKEMIDALGYPIVKEDDNWIILKVSVNSTIKIEKPDWNHLLVSYDINENGEHIEQKQGFKTMGYMPMVSSGEVIVQTIKEKIWDFGLGEKPEPTVKSENICNVHASLIRDLYIIAYLNEGKITDQVDTIVQEFAKKYNLREQAVDHIRNSVSGSKGKVPTFILNCFPEYKEAKENYIKELISLYKYTLSDSSNHEAYEYLLKVAEKNEISKENLIEWLKN